MSDTTWITRLDQGETPSTEEPAVRLAVKDCIDVAGVPTTSGSPAVAETAEPAARDAACLAGARAAGARIVGKTNLHELCFGSSGINPHYGTPVNPLDPARIPGGSSSGSAVAVATGEADVAFGTDSGGSIRNPAACCGIVGLKPTWGVVPVDGVRPLAPSLDVVGVLARNVADLAVGATLLSPDLTAGPLEAARVVGRMRLPGTDPTVDAAVDSALLEAGYAPHDVVLDGWDAAHEAALLVLFAEALASNAELWAKERERLGADLVERFTMAEAIDPVDVAAASASAERWRAELARLFEAVDVLVLPTLLGYPPRIGEHSLGPNPAAPAVNLAGVPALSMPVPSGGVFPSSVQLVGPARSETRLLATAARIEAANA